MRHWFCSLWSGDAIWRNRCGLTLTHSWGQHGAHLGPVGPRWAPCWPHEPCYQGCCLNIPSHCLNQWWPIISVALWHSPESDVTGSDQAIKLWNEFENCTVLKLLPHLRAGLGSNTFYQIQIQIQIHFFPEFQIQIQIHRQKSDQIQIQIQIQLIKYKYKYKYKMRSKQNCRHFTDDILKFIVL